MKMSFRKIIRKLHIYELVMIIIPMCLGMLSFGFCVSAAEEVAGTISLFYDQEGVSFKVYKIANIGDDNKAVVLGDFAKYKVDLNDSNAAVALENYILRDNPVPFKQDNTNDSYSIKFSELSEGIYLVCGESTIVGNFRHKPVPVLVKVPKKTTTEIIDYYYTVKHETQSLTELVDVSIVILWNDSQVKELRPSSIVIQLLKDGEVVETVVLDEDNDWKYEWKDLSPDHIWTVTQGNLPDGYVNIFKKDGMQHIYINSASKEEIKEPQKPSTPNVKEPVKNDDNKESVENKDNNVNSGTKLPQTGAVWWPVIILVIIGVLFIVLGVIIKRID